MADEAQSVTEMCMLEIHTSISVAHGPVLHSWSNTVTEIVIMTLLKSVLSYTAFSSGAWMDQFESFYKSGKLQ